MIRWSYLLPRLAIAVAVLLGVHFGVAPLARWAMVTSVQATTGADVEIASVWTSLLRGRMQVADVELARNDRSDSNLIEFKSADVELDLRALAEKRYVINRARIRGLRFHQPRVPSGEEPVDDVPTEIQFDDLAKSSHEHTRRWLSQLTSILNHRLEDEFESVRLAQQLAERWPDDYRQLQQQARLIRQRAVQLHQTLSSLTSQRDPMKQVAEMQRRWPEVVQLREEIASLLRRGEQLAQQMERDEAAIQTALQNDREKLEERLQLAQLNGQQLSNLLLGGEIQQWWAQLQPWIELAQWLTDSPEANELGNRGLNVPFDTDRPQPNYLIQYAQLDGQLTFAGQQVAFLGQASDLVLPSASRIDRPTRLKLVTRGPFTAQFFAQLDHTHSPTRQQLVLRCDDLPLPGRTWGRADSLQLAVAPALVQIQAQLIASDDQLDGRLRITQRGAELTAFAPATTVPTSLLDPLNETVGTIESVDLWVDISGPIAAPRCQLRSDLGPQLQQQLHAAGRKLARQQADRMIAKADQQLVQTMAELRQKVLSEQTMLQQQLGAANTVLSGFAEPVASRFQPLNNLLQRF